MNVAQGTSCYCGFILLYDPKGAGKEARVQELYIQASEVLMNAGAFLGQLYGTMSDMAYCRDGETMAALRKVKLIVGPTDIMNSGKLCC